MIVLVCNCWLKQEISVLFVSTVLESVEMLRKIRRVKFTLSLYICL